MNEENNPDLAEMIAADLFLNNDMLHDTWNEVFREGVVDRIRRVIEFQAIRGDAAQNLGDVRTEMRPTSDLNLADFMSRPPDEWPKLITWEELTPGSFEPSFSGYTAAHYCTGNPELGWCLYSRGAGGCWNQRTKQQVSPVAGASPVQHEGRWFWATSTPKAEQGIPVNQDSTLVIALGVADALIEAGMSEPSPRRRNAQGYE